MAAAEAACSAEWVSRSPTTGTPYSASTALASRSVSDRPPAAAINAASLGAITSGWRAATVCAPAARLSARQCQDAMAAKQALMERNSATRSD